MPKGKKRGPKPKVSTQNKNSVDTTKYKVIIAILSTILVMIGIFCCVKWYDNWKLEKSVKDIDGLAAEINAATRDLTKREREDITIALGSALDNMSNKNFIMSVEDSEDTYVTMLYNKKGECISEASDTGTTMVFRSDDKAARFSDEYIDFGTDTSVFSIMKSVYEMVQEGKATIYGVPEENEEEAGEDYIQAVVDIRGWEGIRNLYDRYSPTLSENMIAQMQEIVANLVKEVEESSNPLVTITDTSEANFRYAYAINKETNIVDSAICYVYFGEKDSLNVAWSDLVASWTYNGVEEVYDWELAEDWYTLDWTKLSEWDEDQLLVVEEMLAEEYNKIMTMINQNLEDRGEEPIDWTSDLPTVEEIEQANQAGLTSENSEEAGEDEDAGDDEKGNIGEDEGDGRVLLDVQTPQIIRNTD